MKKAFTLIEILVAMAILVILIGSTIAIFRASTASWRKGEMRAQRYQQARFILQRMTKEISSLFPVSLAGPHCLGSADRFHFISSSGDAPGALIEVGYWLNEDAEELMRSYQSSPDYDFGTFDEEELLCENVTAFNFQYSMADTWQENWDSRPGSVQAGLLPKAVRIEFVLRDERAQHQESFGTIVTIASAAD